MISNLQGLMASEYSLKSMDFFIPFSLFLFAFPLYRVYDDLSA